MTMTTFTGMLKFQFLVEVVIVMVTSHSLTVSRLLCKLNLNSYLAVFECYTVLCGVFQVGVALHIIDRTFVLAEGIQIGEVGLPIVATVGEGEIMFLMGFESQGEIGTKDVVVVWRLDSCGFRNAQSAHIRVGKRDGITELLAHLMVKNEIAHEGVPL